MTDNGTWSGVSVLITGGAGFIGSNLVDSLVSAGAKVWVIDNLDTGEFTNLSNHTVTHWVDEGILHKGEGVIFVNGTIEDSILLNNIIPQVDFIFHLAAIASVARCESNPSEADSINLKSTIEIASIASKNNLRGMCFSSSAALYGNTDLMPIVESTPIIPISKYGESKAIAEESLLKNCENLPAASLRLFNVYGPRQNANSANAGVISILIDRINSATEIKLNGGGKQSRDFVYVQDVCDAFMQIGEELFKNGFDSECNGQAFNVCTGFSNSIVHSVKLIEALVGVNANVIFGPKVDGDIMESLGSPDKLKNLVDWKPKFDFNKGLELTSEWYSMRK